MQFFDVCGLLQEAILKAKVVHCFHVEVLIVWQLFAYELDMVDIR